MTGPSLDSETLAAFLDGKLRGAERERVLATLAASPEDSRLLLEAARVRAQLEPEAVEIPVAPRRFWIPAFVGIAAILLAAIGISRFNESPVRDAVLDLSASLTAPEAANWASPPWSASRGAGSGISERAVALRTGAHLANLEVAAANRDLALAALIAREIASALAEVPASEPTATIFRRLADDSSALGDRRKRREAAAAASHLFSESPWIPSGSWLATARLAAIAGDAAYFAATGGPSRLLDKLERDARSTGDSSLLEILRSAKASTRGISSSADLASIPLSMDSLLSLGAR